MSANLKTGRSKWLPGAIALGSVLMMSLQAEATILFKKNLDDLVTEAEAIVVGTVTGAESHYTAEKDIYTLVTLADLKVLHGRYEGNSLTLQLPGGEVDNDVMEVHGSPKLAVKDRVVVFVQGNGQQLVPIVGWTQGVFRLELDAKSGKQKVKDHERNSVLEVRGNEIVRNQVKAPDATIIERPGQARAGGDASKAGGDAGKADAGNELANDKAQAKLAAAPTEAMDADAFIREIGRTVKEKKAVGKAIKSVGEKAEQQKHDASAPKQ